MKKISKTVAVSILVKPAILVALFGLIGRIGDFTGLQLSLIQPVADCVSELTGLSYDNAAMLVVALIAYCLLQGVSAAYGCLTS